jgi:hypothetical protein
LCRFLKKESNKARKKGLTFDAAKATLYFKNKNKEKYFPTVPVSEQPGSTDVKAQDKRKLIDILKADYYTNVHRKNESSK